jgi:hypothetical protein
MDSGFCTASFPWGRTFVMIPVAEGPNPLQKRGRRFLGAVLRHQLTTKCFCEDGLVQLL